MRRGAVVSKVADSGAPTQLMTCGAGFAVLGMEVGGKERAWCGELKELKGGRGSMARNCRCGGGLWCQRWLTRGLPHS
jgi:hypothetical protein